MDSIDNININTNYEIQLKPINNMKTKLYSLIAATAVCGLASAAETAYTTPVGYVTLGDTTVGQPAIKANTDVSVSVPLHRSTEYAGEVASTTASTITVSGTPAWTVDQWAPGAASPYLVSVNSGTENGFSGLITSNTADTLTVTAITGGDLTNVVATDTIQIYKAWTLITLFPAGSVTPGVRVLAYSGTAVGINLAPNLAYVWTGNVWQQVTGAPGGVQDDAIIHTGESFVIRTIGDEVASLTATGEVPTFDSRTDIGKLAVGVAQDTRLSYVSPVSEVIGVSGLITSGATPGDRVLAFDNNAAGINKAPSIVLVWTGTIWQGLAGVAGDQTNTFTFDGGQGYVFRRLAAAPVGVVDWQDEQSYNPL
jgi:uncharacterized protein (TIGR02597 family)